MNWLHYQLKKNYYKKLIIKKLLINLNPKEMTFFYKAFI